MVLALYPALVIHSDGSEALHCPRWAPPFPRWPFVHSLEEEQTEQDKSTGLSSSLLLKKQEWWFVLILSQSKPQKEEPSGSKEEATGSENKNKGNWTHASWSLATLSCAAWVAFTLQMVTPNVWALTFQQTDFSLSFYHYYKLYMTFIYHSPASSPGSSHFSYLLMLH